mmetsp:Transcript_23121/g.66757  ORF Transcript_23121/g.66757 Transcript_23121/m.66757 type:complete len:296 (-) Transcript_23121:561-1448(-)
MVWSGPGFSTTCNPGKCRTCPPLDTSNPVLTAKGMVDPRMVVTTPRICTWEFSTTSTVLTERRAPRSIRTTSRLVSLATTLRRMRLPTLVRPTLMQRLVRRSSWVRTQSVAWKVKGSDQRRTNRPRAGTNEAVLRLRPVAAMVPPPDSLRLGKERRSKVAWTDPSSPRRRTAEREVASDLILRFIVWRAWRWMNPSSASSTSRDAAFCCSCCSSLLGSTASLTFPPSTAPSTDAVGTAGGTATAAAAAAPARSCSCSEISYAPTRRVSSRGHSSAGGPLPGDQLGHCSWRLEGET